MVKSAWRLQQMLCVVVLVTLGYTWLSWLPTVLYERDQNREWTWWLFISEYVGFIPGVISGLYVSRLSGFRMSSKKKNKKLKAEQDADTAAERAEPSQEKSEREMLLRKE